MKRSTNLIGAVLTRREKSNGTFEGARKVAALLSMVDSKTADALLAQFEPEVVAEIAREAKNMKGAPREDFEEVLADFLKSASGEGNDFEVSRSTDSKRVDVLTPEILARSLRNERPFVGAVVLANITARERLRTLELLPQEQAEGIRRIASAWLESTPVSKEMELEFARRALQNER